jgi:hypothetical protein
LIAAKEPEKKEQVHDTRNVVDTPMVDGVS